MLLSAIPLSAILLMGCGGGGGGSSGGGGSLDNTSCRLEWVQEPSYEDNTYLNVMTEIRFYNLYVSDFPWFDNDVIPVAQIAGVFIDNNGVMLPTQGFDLSLLREHGIIVDNNVKFVSLTSETFDGSVSVFTEPSQWGEIQLKMEVTQ